VTDEKNGRFSRRDIFRRAFLGMSKAGGRDLEAEQAQRKDEESLQAARSALALSDYASAEPHLRTFLRKNFTRSDVRKLYALCLYRLGKYIQSRVEFLRLTRLGAVDDRTLAYLALAQLRTGQRERSLETLRSSTTNDPLWSSFFSTALARIGQPENDEQLNEILESLMPPERPGN
jgi:tetratricopeptide (TPR) repeat protein